MFNRKITSAPYGAGRFLFSLSSLLGIFLCMSGVARSNWKGPHTSSAFQAGALSGVALVDNSAGFALLGDAAINIVPKGWISEISNSVFLEAEVGPVFFNNVTDVMVNTHLRWDFHKNEDWTFYFLGGLGGVFGSGIYQNRNEIYPRFGLGTLWELWPALALRAELSHELIAVGLSFFI